MCLHMCEYVWFMFMYLYADACVLFYHSPLIHLREDLLLNLELG